MAESRRVTLAPPAAAACCHGHAGHGAAAPAAAAAHAAHPHGTHGGRGWRAASSVTLHCLAGCAIGEWLGLAIGVAFGLPVAVTVTLAVVLSFVSGFALTLVPLLRARMSPGAALRLVWIGETLSIAVMELVMNLVDYHLGGMGAPSLASPQYWVAFAAALLAGYVAALPVNAWLLARDLKKCH